MQPHCGLTRGLGRLDDIQHLLKRHPGAVMQLAVRTSIIKQRGVDQRAGVNDDIGLPEQAGAADGDEVGCAATGTDKMYQAYPSLI